MLDAAFSPDGRTLVVGEVPTMYFDISDRGYPHLITGSEHWASEDSDLAAFAPDRPVFGARRGPAGQAD